MFDILLCNKNIDTLDNKNGNKDFQAQSLQIREDYLWPLEGYTYSTYVSSDMRSSIYVAVDRMRRSSECVIGTVQYDPLLNRLRQLVVHPSYRGHGVGRLLVNAVIKEAKKAGRASLTVHSWKDSVRFYEKCGFVMSYQQKEGEPPNKMVHFHIRSEILA